jgi:hypothetical protein
MKSKLGMIAAIAIIDFAACEKETPIIEETDNTSIEGTYVGNFVNNKTLKSTEGDTIDATAVITMMDSTLIEFHCYGSNFDSTLMLNLFDDDDTLYVCLTDEDFEHEYGHMMGQGNGMGNGMGMGGGHMNTDTTNQWGHHLYDDHAYGDEHFGGFNRMEHTFDYSFRMMEGDSTYYFHFHGIKN